MSNLRKLTNSKIYFFENEDRQSKMNTLKDFIYFLKFTGKQNIDFSYASDINSLHVNLNIKQNFELDSIPSSLIKDSENNVLDFLSQLKNPYLKELIKELGDLNRKIKNLNPSEIKLTAIIKAILSRSEYIFLDSPDKNLDTKTLNLIKSCIQFEARDRERIIFIKSQRKILWPDVVTNIISKNQNLQYIDTKNPLNPNSHKKITTNVSIPRSTFKKVS